MIEFHVPPFSPIDTGQQFPSGLLLRDGPCTQCGRRDGKVVRVELRHPALMTRVVMPCAECLADLVTGSQVMALGVGVWAEVPGGTSALIAVAL